MINYDSSLERSLKIRGVYYEPINTEILTNIFAQIEENNMDMVLLEKLPKIAVYSPPDKQPWDDAVTLALTYAEIDYDGPKRGQRLPGVDVTLLPELPPGPETTEGDEK